MSRVFAGDDFVAEDGALAVDASVHCYATLITALGRCGRLDRAHQVLARMVEQGPAPNIRVVNALLGACVRVKNLKAAEKLFASLTGVRGEGFASFVTPATAARKCSFAGKDFKAGAFIFRRVSICCADATRTLRARAENSPQAVDARALKKPNGPSAA